MQQSVSVIIVTFNSGDILFDCLNSLPAGLGPISAEIIIVDNHSQDNTVDQIAGRFPNICVIENSENLGFAAANNQGMAVASASYFLLLNPDVIVGKDAITKMMAYLNRNEDVGIAGPRTFDGRGKLALTAYGSYTPSSILWQYLGFDRLFPFHVCKEFRHNHQVTAEPIDVAWIQGSCMMIRREVYEQIGGLDAGFFLFSEEPDYCARTIEAGWRIVYISDAGVEHRESTIISQYPLIKMRHYHRSPLYYFSKRNQYRSVLILKAGFTLELIIKLVLRFLQLSWVTNQRARERLLAYPTVLQEIWRWRWSK